MMFRHDIDAEEAVNGSLLIDGSLINNLPLEPSDFYSEQNRWIYTACQELYKDGVPINQITVANQLGSKLERSGGDAYLGRLISLVPTSLDCWAYAMIVKKLSQERRVFELADKGDFDGIAKVLREANKPVSIINPKELADGIMDMVNSETPPPLGWGWTDLDKATTGIYPGELIVIGARPSVGKSQILIELAIHLARNNNRVLLASIEMPQRASLERIISIEMGIDIGALRRREIDDWGKVASVAGRVAEWPLHLLPSNISLAELSTNAERLDGLKVLMVDYIQLMRDCGDKTKGDNLVQRVGYITRSLKLLAEDLNISVIAASQLSRAVEQRPNKRPMLSDLRESGNIEQDADVVLLLYRDELYNPSTEDVGVMEVKHAKNRQIPCGQEIKLVWANHKYGNYQGGR